MLYKAIFLSVITSLLLSASNAHVATKRYTILTDGSQGTVIEGTSGGLNWASSGILDEGCPSSIAIDDCFTLQLTSDSTKMLDSGQPKQRIEFYNNKVYDNSWKYYLNGETGATGYFFALMQIFTDGIDSATVTLSAVDGQVYVEDVLNQGLCHDGCPSIPGPLAQFVNRVTEHSLNVTFGDYGSLSYYVGDAETGETLIYYNGSGYFGNVTSTVKFGMYRGAHAGMTNVLSYIGY